MSVAIVIVATQCHFVKYTRWDVVFFFFSEVILARKMFAVLHATSAPAEKVIGLVETYKCLW